MNRMRQMDGESELLPSPEVQKALIQKKLIQQKLIQQKLIQQELAQEKFGPAKFGPAKFGPAKFGQETLGQDLPGPQALVPDSPPEALNFALFAPLHYERNYSYPLLIWLHGPGDDERQVQRIMPLVSMRNYVALGVRGAPRKDESGYDWPQTPAAIGSFEQQIVDAVRLARRKFNIAAKRVFLAGLQSGGTMALRIGLRSPRRFAGLISIGGPFPEGDTPLAAVEQARGLPLFIAHGRGSLRYPVERTCDELRLFHVAGLSVSLRQYPCGDELHSQMLHDMDVWMMEQVTGVGMSSDDGPGWQGLN